MNNVYVFLLCYNLSDHTKLLQSKLDLADIKSCVICDSHTIDQDKYLKATGFINLTHGLHIKKPSAWDKAFYAIHANNLTDRYDYFFFIEDDVYSKEYDTLIAFIQECESIDSDFISKEIRPRSHHPAWRNWADPYISNLKQPRQSFNPLCRLSKNLVNHIMDYKNQYGTFNFHEIIFASLCVEHGLSYTEYMHNNRLNQYIESITFNPILTFDNLHNHKIYHPVKSKPIRQVFKYHNISSNSVDYKN